MAVPSIPTITPGAVVNGTEYGDWIWGDTGPNEIWGHGGGDDLHGNYGDDTIHGGHGNDSMAGWQGNDRLYGDGNLDWGDRAHYHGAYAEFVITYDGALGAWIVADTVPDRDGTDTVSGVEWFVFTDREVSEDEFATVTTHGTAANDTLTGGAVYDRLYGYEGADLLTGAGGNDSLYGGAGNDTLNGGSGSDRMDGGDGEDTADFSGLSTGVDIDMEFGVVGGVGVGIDRYESIEHVIGTSHADEVEGSGAGERIEGGDGHDTLRGNGGDDTLYGGQDGDWVFGGAGNDLLYGGDDIGGDSLKGGYGNDTIIGGTGWALAAFEEDRDDYRVSYNAQTGQFTVVDSVPGRYGTDIVSGVMELEFNYVRFTAAQLMTGPTGEVQVLGERMEGQTLTADVSSIGDTDGVGAFSYQWRLYETVPIPGANGATYTVRPDDYGHPLSVRVTYTDGAGNAEYIDSADVDIFKLVMGTEQADTIYLEGIGADVVQTLGGNDLIWHAAGKDTIDGGSGLDTLAMNNHSAMIGAVLETVDASTMRLRTDDATMTFTNVERVRLGSTYLALDTDPGEHTWQAAALLWAGLGTAPEADLLSKWVREADEAGSMAELAQALLDRYVPHATSSWLVEHLYGSILGMTPSASDVASFTSRIGAGKMFEDNAALLVYAASHPYNTDRMADFTGTAQELNGAYFFTYW